MFAPAADGLQNKILEGFKSCGRKMMTIINREPASKQGLCIK